VSEFYAMGGEEGVGSDAIRDSTAGSFIGMEIIIKSVLL
jgi:hypothetical protein